MKCDKCEKEITNDSKFCKYCGNKILKEIDSTNIVSKDSPTVKEKTKVRNAVSFILLILIIICVSVFIIHDKNIENYRKSNITTSDIKRMIESQYIRNITNVSENYKYIKDGNGRMLATFTYQAYDYTRESSYYTESITFMVMKKNDIVTYVRRPDYYSWKSVYKDNEDFNKQNFWGQVESLGLGTYSKSFISSY